MKNLKIKLFMNDKVYADRITNMLTSNGYNVSTYNIAKAKYIENEDDMILFNPFLDMTNIFEFVREIKKRNKIAIAISNTNNEFVADIMIHSGADFVLINPDYNTIMECVAQIYDFITYKECASTTITNSAPTKTFVESEEDRRKRVSESIYSVLNRLGVPAHIYGYKYIAEALQLIIEDPGNIKSMTKTLYPTVAKKFGTSGSKVERAIRYAIEYCIGDKVNLEDVYKIICWNSEKGRPTNSQFLASVYNYMIVNDMI